MKKYIYVKFQKEGIHKYPDAPEDVSFLRHPHRHIFHFKIKIEVFHDDRDIEFIMFKRELESLFSSGTMDIDYKSCEMLANDLAAYILKKYKGRDLVIDISEDNENGAEIHYEATAFDRA